MASEQKASLPPMHSAEEDIDSIAQTIPQEFQSVLQELQLASEELPTVGSAGHYFEKCKPCVFYHTKGCNNGVGCVFCHLCEAGEKKRRQKERFAKKKQHQWKHTS